MLYCKTCWDQIVRYGNCKLQNPLAAATGQKRIWLSCICPRLKEWPSSSSTTAVWPEMQRYPFLHNNPPALSFSLSICMLKPDFGSDTVHSHIRIVSSSLTADLVLPHHSSYNQQLWFWKSLTSSTVGTCGLICKKITFAKLMTKCLSQQGRFSIHSQQVDKCHPPSSGSTLGSACQWALVWWCNGRKEDTF